MDPLLSRCRRAGDRTSRWIKGETGWESADDTKDRVITRVGHCRRDNRIAERLTRCQRRRARTGDDRNSWIGGKGELECLKHRVVAINNRDSGRETSISCRRARNEAADIVNLESRRQASRTGACRWTQTHGQDLKGEELPSSSGHTRGAGDHGSARRQRINS